MDIFIVTLSLFCGEQSKPI